MNKNKTAFTLVELIVVITILTILWTIAFIALQWYSSNARDSARISDISTIKSWLDVFKIDAWKYPKPTNWVDITFSWWLVWNQWSIWESVITNLAKINKIPLDPLTENEYTYSLLNNNKEFQIWAILENWLTSLDSNLNNNTYAANPVKTYITWTYNWILAKATVNSVTYVIAIPCIISADTTETTVEWSLAKKILACDWSVNAPSTYKTYTHSWWYDFNSTSTWNILVYSWDINNLLQDWNSQIDMLKNLQIAYSWSNINNSDISNILNTDTINNINWSKFIAQVLIKNTLDSSLKVNYNLIWNTWTGNQVVAWNTQPNFWMWWSFACKIDNLWWLKCWWNNTYWQLWNWTNSNAYTPTSVSGLTSWVTWIYTWPYDACAVMSWWNVKCWWMSSANSPQDIAWITDVKKLSVVFWSVCALSNSWTVKCWWDNTYWQLWNWTNTASTTPVSPLLTWNITDISWTMAHLCALTDAWLVKCWWNNMYWQLWNNSTTSTNTPVDIISWISQIYAWYYTTCWLLSSWTVKCWWSNNFINSANLSYIVPTDVTWISNVSKIKLSWSNLFIFDSNWQIKTRWANTYWLIDNTWLSKNDFISIQWITWSVTDVFTDWASTFIMENWQMKFWWNNYSWIKWDWTNFTQTTPLTTPSKSYFDTITNNIYAWETVICMLTNLWELKCVWSIYQSDWFSLTQKFLTDVVWYPSSISEVYMWKSYAYYIKTVAWDIYSWWDNRLWQLWWWNNAAWTKTPTIRPLLANASKIAVWYSHACWLFTWWEVKCWWSNYNWHLWIWSTTTTYTPTTVSWLSSWASNIFSWINNSCALLSWGNVSCWWLWAYWELWNNATSDKNIPDPVWNISSITKVSIWEYFMCWLSNAWTVYCWGRNLEWQLWNWNNTNSSLPIDIWLTWITDISSWNWFTCAITSTWWVKCWWRNLEWQLWNWNTTSSNTPVNVTWLTWVTKLTTWSTHACATLSNWDIKCWWANNSWQSYLNDYYTKYNVNY